MSDKQPMQAAGKGVAEGRDGVDQERVNGRNAGGESGGGAYPNPHTGKDEKQSGFMGHGGQTDIDYRGTGQGSEGEGKTGANPNAGTGSNTD
ncbi:hypothetical protein [Sphingomonas desiccabilis]|uniref:hypothetical protein n=1 Tax=Sphingomonas desiccabilis TaxID=429134 RepID=UPI0017CACDB7|nr:hypothetical protein [Sphingomonas desiccabilis]MBB3912494.1 hypothetical protein [Sphingomonas desiccabilis]